MGAKRIGRVLIVDDQQSNLDAMRQVLKSLNAEILTAKSGEEALEIMRGRDFSVVLLDVHLPKLDGFEVARQMRASSKTQQTPIIFVTAKRKDSESVFKGYQASAVDYLVKPVDMYALKVKVRIFLELHETRFEMKRLLEETKEQAAELERFNQELQRFAKVVAHDLKEPARALLSFSQILSQHCQEGDHSKRDMCLAHIDQNARRMMLQIDDLLTYSRATVADISPERLSLSEALEGVRQELQQPLVECQAEFHVAPDMPELLADRFRLRQLLRALIKNCIQFRSAAPLKIEFAFEAGRYYCRDNGIGIEKDYQGQIFDMFRRLKDPKSADGSGVGLALSRAIVQAHGGEITVESELGRGATFFFSFASPAHSLEA